MPTQKSLHSVVSMRKEFHGFPGCSIAKGRLSACMKASVLVLAQILTLLTGWLRAEPATGIANVSAHPAMRTVLTPSHAELGHAIQIAAQYLKRNCSPNGKFLYQVDTLSAQESSSYNIVRHAGAMYSLGMLRQIRSDSQVDTTLANAASYLQKNYIRAGVKPGQLAVWSKPLPASSDAELGATGLGLVALVETWKANPKSVPLGELQGLGRFLLFLQRPDGSFVHKYSPKTGPVLDWHSLYYPGEAALGLIALYEVDHSREWLDAAARALSYLAKSRAGIPDAPPDHWALIATAKLLPYCTQDGCPASREELLHHAVQISKKLLSLQQIRPDNPALDGAFNEAGSISSTATCIEGLLAALEFLPASEAELRSAIKIAATRGVLFLLRAQIDSGPFAGGMPQAYVFSTAGRIPVRIDYVQHCMSAWIGYKRLIQDP
jgi:hypothetical protein